MIIKNISAVIPYSSNKNQIIASRMNSHRVKMYSKSKFTKNLKFLKLKCKIKPRFIVYNLTNIYKFKKNNKTFNQNKDLRSIISLKV